MKVLMFGWEFPPYSSGGLGTACYGLTKGLSRKGVKVLFVIPHSGSEDAEFVRLIPAGNVKVKRIRSIIQPYLTSNEYSSELTRRKNRIYGSNLFEEVDRYAEIAKKIAQEHDFDIIHCHDWMTYKAGINAKKVSGKPLVVHVHATEFDRTGNLSVNQSVYNREREGMHLADKIIAVSNFTKDKIVSNYSVPPDKVSVVHNAVEFVHKKFNSTKLNNKVVLFLGRITLQKGPDYFLYAAHKALKIDPSIRFIIAGTGDMEHQIIEKAAELGIADKVLFTGFLAGDDIDRAFQMADLYILPSVSEPFGITPLEAIRNETPVIISKQSGVSEVLNHCIKVDFWDIDKMVDTMLGVLNYKEVSEELKENALNEISKLSWLDSAQRCIDVYNEVKGYKKW